MAVFRVEKTRDYTVMSNQHLRDKSLSLKAKGLLSQMLSLPEDWDYTLTGLSYINRESKDAIRTAINELENAGYIERRQTTDERGKFSANEYIIHEAPVKRDQSPDDSEDKTEPQDEQMDMLSSALEADDTATEQADRSEDTDETDELALAEPLLENPTTVKSAYEMTVCDALDTQVVPLDKPTADESPEGTFFARPLLDFPTTGNPSTEKPSPENPTQLNTDIQNKEKQITHLASTESFFPSVTPAREQGRTEGRNEISAKREEIREQIEYGLIVTYENREQINEFVEIMLEVALTRGPTIRISRDAEYPTALVQQRFEQLNSEHIQRVLDGIRENTTRVRNTRAYILASLFNAPSTIDNHYTMQFNHDYGVSG